MESMDQEIPSGPHPLLNHLVLQNVFRFLKHPDLKSASLVCNLWNTAARGRLFQISYVHLNSENLSNFLKLVHGNGNLNLCVGTEIGSRNYQKFHFQGVNMDIQINALLASVLISCGANMKEIVFSKCTFPRIISQSFSCLPNLEIVSFADSISSTHNANEENFGFASLGLDVPIICPKVASLELVASHRGKFTSWVDIFRIFPKIKSLQIQLQKSEDLTELLTALSKSQPLISLTEFNSYTLLEEKHLKLLMDFSKNLTSIDIFCSNCVKPRLLAKFLNNCCSTLKTLRFSCGEQHSLSSGDDSDDDDGCDQVHISHRFPFKTIFKNLTTLEITNKYLESFEFLHFVPNLKSLFILQDDAEDSETSFTKLVESTPETQGKLKSRIEDLTMQFFVSPSSIERLSQDLCPNIKKLSVYLCDDSIREVFQNLLNLEELWIFGTEITDEGITGISLRVLMDESIKRKDEHREFPYVGQCLKLRKFGLYAELHENISDDSIHYGLMDVKELTSVDFPQTAITDAGVQILKTKPNLVHLSAKFFVVDGELVERSTECL